MASHEAPLIALVGSDGSGKSTVGEALIVWLRQRGPAELCHLGKQSDNLGRAVSALPLLGRLVKRGIDTNMKTATAKRGPNFITAIGIYAFTLRRLRRFRRMLRIRAQGVAILADRFPQMSVPEAIDGPGFGRSHCDTGLARILSRLERRQFEWMTSHTPDLVIRLVVDVDTAFARKPDHNRARLAEKIADIGRITFGGAPIVDIDAAQPLDRVLEQARAAIERVLPR